MMNPETISTYLEMLPEPFRKNAIRAQQTVPVASRSKIVSTPAIAIRDAFHWPSTIQGRSYWLNLIPQLMTCEEYEKSNT